MEAKERKLNVNYLSDVSRGQYEVICEFKMAAGDVITISGRL